MTTSEYRALLLSQVRARGRAEAALSNEIGDPIPPDWAPDHTAIRAYFRQQVYGQVSPADTEAALLAIDLADAYADAFAQTVRATSARAPSAPLPQDDD